MSTPPNTGTTDLGATGKIFADAPKGRALRDLSDMGEVFLLAYEIAEGDARRASLLSIAEVRAVADFAATAGIVMSTAIALVEASDAGDQAAARGRLEALCTVTRSLFDTKRVP